MNQAKSAAEELRDHLGPNFKFPWEEGAEPYTPSILPTVLRDSPVMQQDEPVTDLLQRFCPFQGGVAFIMGGALGALTGVFIATYNQIAPPPPVPGQPLPVEPDKVPLRQALRDSMKLSKTKAKQWGKNFAIVGGLYSMTECFIESYRGKKDLKNSVSAGCITGAALAYKSGPLGVCAGCAGFAAFSAIIDTVFVHE